MAEKSIKKSSSNRLDSDSGAQELLERRYLQNAQMTSMSHVWDNPEDEIWNDLEAVQIGRSQSDGQSMP